MKIKKLSTTILEKIKKENMEARTAENEQRIEELQACILELAEILGGDEA